MLSFNYFVLFGWIDTCFTIQTQVYLGLLSFSQRAISRLAALLSGHTEESGTFLRMLRWVAVMLSEDYWYHFDSESWDFVFWVSEPLQCQLEQPRRCFFAESRFKLSHGALYSNFVIHVHQSYPLLISLELRCLRFCQLLRVKGRFDLEQSHHSGHNTLKLLLFREWPNSVCLCSRRIGSHAPCLKLLLVGSNFRIVVQPSSQAGLIRLRLMR